MFASDTLAAALNQQVGNEFGASFQYLQIAAHFHAEHLPELAGFFTTQAAEERAHALKFVDFINDVGAQLAVPAIPAPKTTFADAGEAVQAALDWEIEVTRQINAIMTIAHDEKNHLAMRFLDFFIEEQLEEVNTMSDLRAMIERAGPSRMLDIEAYVARVGHPEAAE